jgi:hypothetical protein
VAAVQSLTRTILFVSLFYDVDSTLAVERGVKAWQKSLTDGHPCLPLEVGATLAQFSLDVAHVAGLASVP